MIEPPLTPDEPFRLAALRQTNVLDSPIEERFERMTRMVCKLMHVPVSAISMVDSDRQWFKSMQGHSATQTPRCISFCGHAILDREIMVVPDATKDVRFLDNPLVVGVPNIVFYAGCPLRSPEGMNIGVLCAIDHKPREMSEDDFETMHDVAAMIESELQTTVTRTVQGDLLKQIESEQRKAMVDSLTRLWNREGILNLLEEEIRHAKSHGELPPVVMVADIDHFKQINDTKGHPVGDEVLRKVAKSFLGGVRSKDAVGRIGGEEFLFVLPGITEKDIALKVAERVRHGIEKDPICSLKVTTSIGMSLALDGAFRPADAMMKAADEQLYEAKNSGRNRVCWKESAGSKPQECAA